MRKHFKKYFIPHEENDYKPHILREVGILVLSVVALTAFAFSAFHAGLIVQDFDFIAAVLPSVLVDLTNQERKSEDILGLLVNPTLEEAALMKAQHMAENGYFAHVSPNGIDPWYWFIQAGYTFTHAGENLAVNFSDSADVKRAWMNSSAHRENILNNDFTEIGIATAEGIFEGKQTIFIVQLFGRPALASVAGVASPDVIEVEEESETFIAVVISEASEEAVAEMAEGESDVEVREEVGGEEAVGLVPQASLFERMMSQPRQILKYLYLILGGIVVLALILFIFIEAEKQHPLYVLYGVLFLALILLLVYLNRQFIFGDLLII